MPALRAIGRACATRAAPTPGGTRWHKGTDPPRWRHNPQDWSNYHPLKLLVLWVEDDGPGIPPEQALRLGERGARADLSTPGHGIGLAVVREICQAYGGDLTISRSPLGGALVRARLGA